MQALEREREREREKGREGGREGERERESHYVIIKIVFFNQSFGVHLLDTSNHLCHTVYICVIQCTLY